MINDYCFTCLKTTKHRVRECVLLCEVCLRAKHLKKLKEVEYGI